MLRIVGAPLVTRNHMPDIVLWRRELTVPEAIIIGALIIARAILQKRLR